MYIIVKSKPIPKNIAVYIKCSFKRKYGTIIFKLNFYYKISYFTFIWKIVIKLPISSKMVSIVNKCNISIYK